MLKRREEKLQRKAEAKKKGGLTEEEREIAKKVKNKKKEAKKLRARETDEFDAIIDKYKSKVLKSLKKTANDGPAFEEIEMSDD